MIRVHFSRFWPFFFAHAQKRRYFYFRSKICRLNRSQRRRFPISVRITGSPVPLVGPGPLNRLTLTGPLNKV